jgi:hypothetical protein
MGGANVARQLDEEIAAAGHEARLGMGGAQSEGVGKRLGLIVATPHEWRSFGSDLALAG